MNLAARVEWARGFEAAYGAVARAFDDHLRQPGAERIEEAAAAAAALLGFLDKRPGPWPALAAQSRALARLLVDLLEGTRPARMLQSEIEAKLAAVGLEAERVAAAMRGN